MEESYLSVAEFAEAAGVSKQAVYKQVNNENSQISPYILRDGKKTLIKATALNELYGVDIIYTTQSTHLTTQLNDEENESQPSPIETEVDKTTLPDIENQPVNPESTPNNQPVSTDYIEFLKAEIAELKADKAEREQQFNNTIKEKDDIIKQQTEQLANLAQQIADIASKAIITTSQQQYLTAAEKMDKQEVVEATGNDRSIITETKQEKKSFWQRLFG